MARPDIGARAVVGEQVAGNRMRLIGREGIVMRGRQVGSGEQPQLYVAKRRDAAAPVEPDRREASAGEAGQLRLRLTEGGHVVDEELRADLVSGRVEQLRADRCRARIDAPG